MRTIMKKNIVITDNKAKNNPIDNKQLANIISGLLGPLSNIFKDQNDTNINDNQTKIIQSLIGAFPNIWYDLHNYISDENVVTDIRDYKSNIQKNIMNEKILENNRTDFKKYIIHILYTIEQLSIKDGKILGLDTEDEYNKQVMLCLRNRTWISKMISALGLMEPSNIIEDRESRHIRMDVFFMSVITKNISGIEFKTNTSGGKQTRKKRRVLTNRTHRKRYVTNPSQMKNRKSSQKSNRSKKNKTRRKRHY